MSGELGVETLARRIRDHYLSAVGGRAHGRCRTRRTRNHRNLGPIRRIEFAQAQFESVQRLRADFVHAKLAGVGQDGQPDGAYPRVEFGDSRTLRNLGAHVFDDLLCDVEIVLPEGARWIVHRRTSESLDHARGPAPVVELWTEYDVRGLEIAVEPQAVQLRPQPFTDQFEAHGQGRGQVAVGDQHH